MHRCGNRVASIQRNPTGWIKSLKITKISHALLYLGVCISGCGKSCALKTLTLCVQTVIFSPQQMYVCVFMRFSSEDLCFWKLCQLFCSLFIHLFTLPCVWAC